MSEYTSDWRVQTPSRRKPGKQVGDPGRTVMLSCE